MKRKPIQFQDLGGDKIVLCDDGTLWLLSARINRKLEKPELGDWEWSPFPNVPQPTEPPITIQDTYS